jgi:DinB superfamily
MPDESLLLLAKEIRGKTLRILEDVTEQQALFAAPGLQNSILWHAGHSFVVVEFLSVSAATGKPPLYSQDWLEKFGWESRPATVKQWPTLAEVKAKLIDQADRLIAAIQPLTDQQLAQTIGKPGDTRVLRYAILHGLHDEANHQGEMWLLKKLQSKLGGQDK